MNLSVAPVLYPLNHHIIFPHVRAIFFWLGRGEEGVVNDTENANDPAEFRLPKSHVDTYGMLS